jgi:hypothetical protein
MTRFCGLIETHGRVDRKKPRWLIEEGMFNPETLAKVLLLQLHGGATKWPRPMTMLSASPPHR